MNIKSSLTNLFIAQVYTPINTPMDSKSLCIFRKRGQDTNKNN